jgi:hypothetical protein
MVARGGDVAEGCDSVIPLGDGQLWLKMGDKRAVLYIPEIELCILFVIW